MSHSTSRFSPPRLAPEEWWPLVTLLALILGFSALGLAFQFPTPSVDDPAIKSPAAELVEQGRLALPSMMGRLPGAEVVHASYPPGYPLAIAIWFWLFGVGLTSSLAFSYFIHAAQSICLWWITRWLIASTSRDDDSHLPRTIVAWIPVAIALLHFANITLLDRMEDLGLLFAWLALWQAQRPLVSARPTLSAVGLGLAWACLAQVSPFLCLLVSVALIALAAVRVLQAAAPERTKLTLRIGREYLVASSIVALLLGAWITWIETTYPGSLELQFFGHMRELKHDQHRGGLLFQWNTFVHSLTHSPGQIPAMSVGLICLLAIVVRFLALTKTAPPLMIALSATMLFWLPVLIWTRPDSYPYIVGLWTLFMPACGWLLADWTRKAAKWPSPTVSPAWIAASIALCVLFSLREATTHAYRASRLPEDERAAAVFARLHETIPPADRVAVMSRYWNAFQGRNPWLDAFFSSRTSSVEVEKCDWLVLVPETGSPSFLRHFEFVERHGSLPPEHPTYGYVLYRRKTTAVGNH